MLVHLDIYKLKSDINRKKKVYPCLACKKNKSY